MRRGEGPPFCITMHLSVGVRRKEGNDFLPPLFLFVLNCEEEEEEEENANEQKRKKEEREELSISLHFFASFLLSFC